MPRRGIRGGQGGSVGSVPAVCSRGRRGPGGRGRVAPPSRRWNPHAFRLRDKSSDVVAGPGCSVFLCLTVQATFRHAARTVAHSRLPRAHPGLCGL